MNIVWFVPALVGSALVLLTVKSSYPPSPPSRSAQLNGHNSPEISYLKSIWILLRNLPFMILTLTIGKFALHLLAGPVAQGCWWSSWAATLMEKHALIPPGVDCNCKHSDPSRILVEGHRLLYRGHASLVHAVWRLQVWVLWRHFFNYNFNFEFTLTIVSNTVKGYFIDIVNNVIKDEFIQSLKNLFEKNLFPY